jgi:Zn-dependent protease
LGNKKWQGRGKIRIPWYSVLFWLLLLVWEPQGELLLPLLCALLHELGHYGAACALGVGVERITVYPFGADMRLSSALRSYRADLIIAASGAAVNLLLAGVGFALENGVLIACNLLLAVVNLLPVAGLDGGAILIALAGMGGWRGERLVRITSFIGLFFLWLAAVYILLIAGGDPSLFLLACGLFVSVFLRGQRTG